MTGSGPDQPFSGEYPPLEDSAPPNEPPPVDYPADAGLPPPVYPPPYPSPPGYPGYPGYPPAPGYYPAAYDPYRPVKPPGTNGKAIAALVCSVAGFLCCGLSAIAGLILGIMAMRETKRTGQDGFAIALVGTIIGGLAVAGVLIYVLFSIALVSSGWQWAP